MAKSQSILKAIFRGIERANKTYTIEVGPIRATGVPALLVGVGGIVLAGAAASLVARAGASLPETLREARALAETLRSDQPRLKA